MGTLIFIVFWIIVLVVLLGIFYYRGLQTLAIFPKVEDTEIKYRDKLAVGHLLSKTKTKFSGVDKSLHVVVTKNELWLTSSPLLAGIILRNGLLHKIDLKQISSAKLIKDRVEVAFKTENGTKIRISLKLKNENQFLDTLKGSK